MLLVAALLFWWPIVARDPGAVRLSHPGRMLYLFLSMPVMSLLGFVISSSRRVLYAHYIVSGRLLGVSPLADQRLAGTLMWESSMLVSVVALSAVLLDWMHRDEVDALRADVRHDRQARRHRGGTGAMDLRLRER
jgi:putative copper resistance protein D